MSSDCRHQLFWRDRGAVLELKGVVTEQSMREASNAFYADPRSDGIRYMLVDFLAADELELHKRDLATFAGVDSGASRTIKSIKLAIITADETIHRKAQTYIQFASLLKIPWQFDVFTSREEAEQWVAEN
jgi:hypothetical protein